MSAYTITEEQLSEIVAAKDPDRVAEIIEEVKGGISVSVVRELLDYNPETGELFWTYRDRKWFASDGSWKRWNAQHAGNVAFTAINPGKRGGYKMGSILGKLYYAHRIVFLHYHGYMPKEIDHINHDRADNRITNLRETDRKTNMKNLKPKKE